MKKIRHFCQYLEYPINIISNFLINLSANNTATSFDKILQGIKIKGGPFKKIMVNHFADFMKSENFIDENGKPIDQRNYLNFMKQVMEWNDVFFQFSTRRFDISK